MPYGFDSIMHYGRNEGANFKGGPTIVPRIEREENEKQMGQRKRLSQGDMEMLMALYCNPGTVILQNY